MELPAVGASISRFLTHIWSATSDLASGVEDPPTRRGLIVEWQQQPDFAEPPLSIEGAADHWNHRQDEDYYSQPGLLFRLMTAEQKKALFENTAHAMSDAPKEIKVRHNGNCLKADPAYGEGVAKALARIIHEASTARVDQADLTGFLGLWTLRRGV